MTLSNQSQQSIIIPFSMANRHIEKRFEFILLATVFSILFFIFVVEFVYGFIDTIWISMNQFYMKSEASDDCYQNTFCIEQRTLYILSYCKHGKTTHEPDCTNKKRSFFSERLSKITSTSIRF